MRITVEQAGRRYYLRGDTYAIRDSLRAAGATWDADAKAWWTGKRETAEALIARFSSSNNGGNDNDNGGTRPNNVPRDGMDTTVSGRAEYKGRTYYIAGSVSRPDGRWGRADVRHVTTRDGQRMLLIFRDATSQFWASVDAIEIVKEYETPQTVQSLRDFAAQAEANRAAGRPANAHEDDCECRRCMEEYADALSRWVMSQTGK